MLRRLLRMGIVATVVMALGLASAPGVFAATGADLSIAMSGPTRIKSGGFYTYTITVTNHGPATATRINIMGGGTDQIDEVSTTCQDNGSSSQSWCYPADLAAGASVTATYRLQVTGFVPGESRHAIVGASVGQDLEPNPDSNLDNNQVQLAVFIYGKPMK
ncbi:MAG TPA: hypothetical protein VIK65_06415 [Candidatus Limnocylindrales bacterium]|jgi:uncharacterized repeat protein (TIGR01451 family)